MPLHAILLLLMSHRQVVSVPGRVNLIGEHIDYHHLPVLPMAIQRQISVTFQSHASSVVQATSPGYPDRRFDLTDETPFGPGDWGNYLKAAVVLLRRRWKLDNGVIAHISSNLSPAAGLSSSSALISGFALALLHANGLTPTLDEMMALLPEGEQYVGTRGGAMDHAAVLASRAGAALLVGFSPFKFEPIPIPPGWSFLVAHSLVVAEKSGTLRAEYNQRRVAGTAASKKLGLSYFGRTDGEPLDHLLPNERDAYLHVTSETRRVEDAVKALRGDRIEQFGALLNASHRSLRDNLKVSHPSLDALVESALAAGALGARLTGAGFGGCAIALCRTAERTTLRSRLIDSFYAGRAGFVPEEHLLFAEPSAGALPV